MLSHSFSLLAAAMNLQIPQAAPVISGVTFSGEAALYVPLREVGQLLGVPVVYRDRTAWLGDAPMRSDRRLFDGTLLVRVEDMEASGIKFAWMEPDSAAALTFGERAVVVERGEKRTVIDKATQTLEGYQGERLVIRTPVSTGRRGSWTPVGTFTAGPAKHRMHRSRLYNGSPMPFSVQVTGNFFIHGYPDVPSVPASHGCVRMPLDRGNPARWFFDWVDLGTPITIHNGAPADSSTARASSGAYSSKPSGG